MRIYQGPRCLLSHSFVQESVYFFIFLMVSQEGELDFLPQQRFSSHKGSVEALFGPRGIEISAFQTLNFGLCGLIEID